MIEVDAPKAGGLFHPKIWILRFTAPKQPICYRLLCLSRSLTFERAWDTILRLDGELSDRAGFSPRVVQETTPQPTMISLVAAGLGIAFVSASMPTIGRPGGAYRPLRETAPVLKLAIAWCDPIYSPILPRFLQLVTDWSGRSLDPTQLAVGKQQRE
ncbi:hypothetical protein HC928_03090 [bacterium]|nr:hypothetical protein [bacterium]